MSGWAGETLVPSEAFAVPPFTGAPGRDRWVEFHGLTEIGAMRETHEDAIVVGGTMAAASGARIGGAGPVAPSGLVFAVVDGMGGYAGGAAAAGLIAAGLAGAASGVAPGGWRAWLKTMSDRVSAAGRAWGTAEMGATAVILVVRPHRVEVVNVGDCRAYRIANGQVDQLSVDDRVATPRGDAVTQALGGASRPIDPHEMEAPLPEAPTRFVLCSDGLFGALAPEELASLLVRPGRPEEIADALADAAYRRQSRDNFSLIVISVRPGAALAVPSPDPEDTVVNLSLPPIPPMR